MAEQRREGDDCQHRKHEEESVGVRCHLSSYEHRRHKRKQPKNWFPANLFEQWPHVRALSPPKASSALGELTRPH